MSQQPPLDKTVEINAVVHIASAVSVENFTDTFVGILKDFGWEYESSVREFVNLQSLPPDERRYEINTRLRVLNARLAEFEQQKEELYLELDKLDEEEGTP